MAVGRLRFALLHDGARLEQWHLRCLSRLQPEAELSWSVTAAALPPPSSASRVLNRYLARLERRSVVNTEGMFAHLPPVPRETNDVVDFVLGLGRVEVPRGLADVARLGVWRFEHELDGSRPPFLGEVCRGDPVTRAALVQLDGRMESPVTLESGHFRTDPRSYARSREKILEAIASWPARACRRVSLGVMEPPTGASAERPSEPESLARLVIRMATARLALAWQRLFRHPQWNVGVLDRPIEAFLAPGAYTSDEIDWFPLRGRRGFLADPFAVQRGDRVQVLCEYFDYRTSVGRIRALELARDGFGSRTDDVYSPAFHVSYPFLLDLPEGLHCVPETSEVGEVALYRVAEHPEQWEKVAVMLDGVPGVDPTAFCYDGKWWLMCTRKGTQEDTELLVWHAPAANGPWRPHPLNPVKTDVRSARPAGPPFVHESRLYRPAQDCSRTYGGRVVIQRVVRLTPTEFAEEPVAVLEASPRSWYPVGPHTVTAVGGRVLVDGRREVFVPAALVAFLRIWAGNVRARALRR